MMLDVDALETGYGNVQVLWGAKLGVAEGETVVLLGPNGAGKTTLLRCLGGLLPAWRGRITLRGEDLTARSPRARVRAGISSMSELGIFPGLTVAENLDLGALFVPRAQARRRREQLFALFPILPERRRHLAGSLSGGQRKMLGIAKALAAEPKLLLMDEPSAGLSPLLVHTVIDALRSCREGGVAMLIAEQNVAFLELGDRVCTLEGGRVGFTGRPEQLRADDGLRRAYFGLGEAA